MIEHRSYLADLEVRSEHREIVGLAVPYNAPTMIGSYTETFMRGAFADAGTHPLTASHPRDGGELPIGVSTELREANDGLHGIWKVSRTNLGDEVLELVADGALTGLSIGFVPLPGGDRWSHNRTKVERLRAELDHVGVVRRPAYDTARIAAIRAEQQLRQWRLQLALRQR
jgi:HK97 family phage prohead protease